MLIFGFLAFLALVLAFLLWRDHFRARPAAPRPAPAAILVDGSNVMWWKDDAPQLTTLVEVTQTLHQRGFDPAFVFDASAGHRLFGRYRDDDFMAAALGLDPARVLVVPKGEVADRFLLTVARERQLPILTNDRYREWLESFPEAAAPGRLIRGGYRGGRLWLDLP